MSTRFQLARLGGALAVMLVFVTFWGHPKESTDNRLPIRVAYFPNLTHAAPVLGFADGTFQRAVPAARLVPVTFNAGPEEMEALRAGGVDLAFLGPAPAINALAKGDSSPIRLLSGSCFGGASLVCRADLAIRSVEDLAGNTVAVPQFGGTQDISLRHFLAAKGVKDGSVQIIPVKNADLGLLFDSHQLSAAWVPEPWATVLVEQHGARRVLDERTLWPGGRFATTVLAVRTEFLKAHPDLVKAFIAAHKAVILELQTRPEKSREAVGEELKRLTGKALPEKVLREAWAFLDFGDEVDANGLAADAQTELAAGYLKSAPAGDGWLKVTDVR